MPLDDEPRFEAVGFVQDGLLVDSTGATDLVLENLANLATWSEWLRMDEAVRSAPTTPGVYMARTGPTGPIVYVGMAGERRGSGVRGRLKVYASGKATTSGLGEAVFDRALADPEWLAQRIERVRAGEPERAKRWGQLAFERVDPYLRWAETASRADALDLERQCIAVLAERALWNRLT